MSVSPPILRSTDSVWRLFALTSVVSIGIGLVVATLMGFGSDMDPDLAELAEGGLTGFMINAVALSGELLLRKVPGTERYVLAVRVVAFFVGGVVGLYLGGWTASLFGASPVTFADISPMRLVFFGLFAIGVGFTFRTFESLRHELRSSVARLKDQEFAEKELATARSLQERLLPPDETSGPGFAIATRNVPARVVAGDFYDVFRDTRGRVCFVVGDVSGKGMAAALIMATVKAMLPLVAADRSVGETLSELNERLLRDLEKRDFVALAFGHYDPASGELEIANAGLPDPYLIRDDASEVETVEVSGTRLPLGVRSSLLYQSSSRRLRPGDRLLMLSDGLPEAPVREGEPIGYRAFQDLLEATVSEERGSPGEWIDGLLAALRDRTISPQDDDWTLLCLEAR